MQISLSALRRLRLSPNALAVALYLLDTADTEGRVMARTTDVADEVDLSLSTAQRAVRELITRGFITRIVRGVYQVTSDLEVSPVTEEVSPVTETAPVYKASKASKTETANAVSDAPSASEAKGIELVRYTDDGDGLGGFGLLEPKAPAPKKTGRKSVPNMHRSVPRDEWTMEFVVKEFRHRMHLWLRDSGKSIMGDDLARLAGGLRRWKSEYGLTVQEAATLCDMFWDSDETRKIGNDLTATRLYLHFVKMNLDGIRGNVVTDEYRQSVMSQDLL